MYDSIMIIIFHYQMQLKYGKVTVIVYGKVCVNIVIYGTVYVIFRNTCHTHNERGIDIPINQEVLIFRLFKLWPSETIVLCVLCITRINHLCNIIKLLKLGNVLKPIVIT